MFKARINLFISIFDIEKKQLSAVSTNETRYSPIVSEINSSANSIDLVIKQMIETYCATSIASINNIILIDAKKHEDIIDLYYACSSTPGTKLKQGYLVSMNLAYIHPFARKAASYV